MYSVEINHNDMITNVFGQEYILNVKEPNSVQNTVEKPTTAFMCSVSERFAEVFGRTRIEGESGISDSSIRVLTRKKTKENT